MDGQSVISCRVSASGPGLKLSIRVDDQTFFEGDPYQAGEIRCAISDDQPGDHRLKLVLSGKTRRHTQIDDLGQILHDITATIDQVAFDDIPLGHLMVTNAEYTHDRNGTAPETQEKFYGTMGCNGTVTLPFTTPIYLWLLENM